MHTNKITPLDIKQKTTLLWLSFLFNTAGKERENSDNNGINTGNITELDVMQFMINRANI